jgi:hypothetical protein
MTVVYKILRGHRLLAHHSLEQLRSYSAKGPGPSPLSSLPRWRESRTTPRSCTAPKAGPVDQADHDGCSRNSDSMAILCNAAFSGIIDTKMTGWARLL